MQFLTRLHQKKEFCKFCLYLYYAGLVLVALIPVFLMYGK